MDLQSLNSGPTPTQKEWLNPICGSVTSGSITSDTINVGTSITALPLFTSNVLTTSTAGPFTLTPIQIVGAVLANTYNPGPPTTVTYTLPSAADIVTFLETKEPAFYFEFKVSNSRASVTMSFTFGAGCTYVGGGTSFALVGAGQATLCFSFINGVCTVYG